MPFREKSAWISMLSVLIVYGFYFQAVGHAAWVRTDARSGGLLLIAILVLVVTQVVFHIIAALLKPDEAQAPRDERDQLIELRSMRVAYYGLATSVAMACFFGSIDPPIIFNTNALLFLLVTAEILRCGCQIVQYRRGA